MGIYFLWWKEEIMHEFTPSWPKGRGEKKSE
jgi:hypothetical protein